MRSILKDENVTKIAYICATFKHNVVQIMDVKKIQKSNYRVNLKSWTGEGKEKSV